ncbi:ABC transporter ATP-binding protein [Bifidobacterium sp. 82T10]|uniref:ABC transporter ATP-binding protein n=1 Tax=Bifidobacterium miconis TaxID=2834435 RepID=A0ABS6WH79_9BIFI|nr:ABC transporter ATP-binding protein [Bifidobacterium miconis]MBW3092944.1 ABC transporter ATP-binding protein [Bifidobacterium miconis]
MLEISHVSKSFGDMQAVRDVSLRLRPGRVTAVVGPNGAGKSTLLRMACGLLVPDSGSVTLDGRPIASYGSGLYRRLSAVLEDSSLAYMSLKGWDNLDYQGALYGFGRRETRERCAELLDMLDLRRHMDKHVDDWSRGTQQKLALVTALLPRPQVLLLDESTLGLDVVAKRDFLDAVHASLADGVAVMMTSHQSEVIEHVADDVVLIEHGQTLFSDTFDAFMKHYAVPGDDAESLEQVLLGIFDQESASDSDQTANQTSDQTVEGHDHD